MKKLSLILSAVAIAVLVFSGCKKKTDDPGNSGDGSWYQPEQKQRSLLLNFTATWCTYCGQWGHPAFHAAEDGLGDNALPFAVQAAQSELSAVQYKPGTDTPYYARHLADMTPPASLLQGINVGGYPTLCVNNKGGYGPGSQATMIADANTFNANKASANIDFGVTKSMTGLNIRSTVRFFDAANGEYYVTFFITQNNISHRQNVSGNYIDPYTHNDVIRAFPITNAKEMGGITAGLNKTFGDAIISGDITANKYVNLELNYTADNKSVMYPNGWVNFIWDMNSTQNLFITGLVWKKDLSSGKFVFVNGVRKPL